MNTYSEFPKSGRPDFGIFETCPVPKRPDFGRPVHSLYIVRILNVQFQSTKTAVWNRFWSTKLPKRSKSGLVQWSSDVRNPDIRNPDINLYGLPNRTSGNRTFTVLWLFSFWDSPLENAKKQLNLINLAFPNGALSWMTLQWMSENLTSGLAKLTKKLQDFEHPVIGRPKTILLVRLSDVYCISNVWKPDKTSGFQTL